MAWPVADRLRELGVRFAFFTGYEAEAIPKTYTDVYCAHKQVVLRDLRAAANG